MKVVRLSALRTGRPLPPPPPRKYFWYSFLLERNCQILRHPPRPQADMAKHIFTKRKQLELQLHRMYWIIGRKSKLSLENKLLIYKIILRPIWTYGIPLWGTASNSNIEILQRCQNKVLRSIVNAPRYVPNTL